MASTLTKGLTGAQLKRFQEMLTVKAEEIRTNLRASKAGKALIGEQTQNLEDLPAQSHEEWIFLNRNSIDVMLLREVQEALSRLEDNSYGHCLECEEPISLKRLEAIPWARYCITCQEEIAAQQQEDAARRESRR